MSNLIELEGPKKLSRDKTEYLVFFLHGWGADGNDLIQLSNHWNLELPNVTFLAPNAPDICTGNPEGRQWFEIMTDDREKIYNGLERAYELLNQYIERSLYNHKVKNNNFFLVGFSQGTMLALHLALRQKCLGVVGYSGALIEGSDTQSFVKNNILLLHGEEDNIVPISRMYKAYDKLKSLKVNVQKHISKNLQHSINEEGLRKGFEFIKNNL